MVPVTEVRTLDGEPRTCGAVVAHLHDTEKVAGSIPVRSTQMRRALVVSIPVSSPAGYGCSVSREGEAWRAGRVRSIAPASKAVRGLAPLGGSNPSPSAKSPTLGKQGRGVGGFAGTRGAVGSAAPSHGEGRRFKSCRVHEPPQRGTLEGSRSPAHRTRLEGGRGARLTGVRIPYPPRMKRGPDQ